MMQSLSQRWADQDTMSVAGRIPSGSKRQQGASSKGIHQPSSHRWSRHEGFEEGEGDGKAWGKGKDEADHCVSHHCCVFFCFGIVALEPIRLTGELLGILRICDEDWEGVESKLT